MALITSKSKNIQEGVSNDPLFSSSTNDLSVASYRVNNRVRIFIKSSKNTVEIFRGYTSQEFSVESGIEYSDYGGYFPNMIKSLGLGEVWNSAISSITKETLGESLSGSVLSDIKPFISGSKQFKFDLPCVLPLIIKGDGTDTFDENIAQWINSLLYVSIANKSTKVDNFKDSAVSSVKGWINDLWEESGFTGTFMNVMHTMIDDYIDNFVSGLYILENPIQFKTGTDIILRLGPYRIDNLIITNVRTQFGPIVYTNKTNGYPDFAKVTISLESKERSTREQFMLGTAKVSGVTEL